MNSWLANRNTQFWALHLAGWAGWVVLFALRGITTLGGVDFVVLIIDAAAGALLTFPLRYLYRYVWEKPIVTRVITVLAASYVVALIWQPIKNYVGNMFEWNCAQGMECLPLFSGLIGYSYYLVLCWSGLYFGIKYYQLLQEERRKSLRASAMAHEAQLRMLRYQLNPHFLFNTLNAISTLILNASNDPAREMVTRLSSFLRYSLDNDPMQRVDLAHEIATMRLYLDIEQVRFEDRLRVTFDIEPAAENALIPSLLLQPLIENAIKYAVAAREEGGTIRVSAQVFANELLLEISDDGPGIDLVDGRLPDYNGVGLRNTVERLNEIYGANQSCTFSNGEPSGLTIRIRIPYEAARRETTQDG